MTEVLMSLLAAVEAIPDKVIRTARELADTANLALLVLSSKDLRPPYPSSSH